MVDFGFSTSSAKMSSQQPSLLPQIATACLMRKSNIIKEAIIVFSHLLHLVLSICLISSRMVPLAALTEMDPHNIHSPTNLLRLRFGSPCSFSRKFLRLYVYAQKELYSKQFCLNQISGTQNGQPSKRSPVFGLLFVLVAKGGIYSHLRRRD